MIKLQIIFGPTVLTGHVSMLGDRGSLKHFLADQADPLHLAFVDIIVKALRAAFDCSSGHTWAPGVGLSTSALTELTLPSVSLSS